MKSKSIIKTLLLIVILIASLLLLSGKVEATTYTAEHLRNKFNEIKNMEGYRAGDYYKWNDGGWYSDYCGSGHAGWQCHGYGINLFDWLFEQCAMCSGRVYDMNNVCVGDLVRYNNDPYGEHTIIVQDVVGDTVYFTDANGDGAGHVRWNQTTTKSYLQSKLVYIAHASGNNVKTLSAIKPDAPSNIKVTNLGGTSVKVTFDRVSNADHYDVVIYYATDVQNGNWNRIKAVTTTSTSATFTMPKGEYYAYVHTVSKDGLGSDGGGLGAKFSVEPITSVSLNTTSVSMYKNNTYTLKATINPTNTTDSKTLTWSSSNTSVATVSSSGKVTANGVGTATITVKTSTGKTKTCNVTVTEPTKKVNVQYTTHVQNVGWQSYVSNGATAGTEHKHLRLEGIKIKLDSDYAGGIEYRTHVQNYGWLPFTGNNVMNGTEHKSLRLEAIEIILTGDIANYYDVYYRVHAENFGWLDWAKNGESAGTQGYSYRLEAIQIKLVKKGSSAPGSTTRHFVKNTPSISYATHVQNVGWQGAVSNGAMSGTEHKHLRLEAIRIQLQNNGNPGGIEYSTHVQNIGWQGWKQNGQDAGTSHQSLRLEAIKIKLTGEIANEYDVYYRVHCENFGWMGWAKNGQEAGSQGYSYRLEGIQIKLVKKGSPAPGSTANCFKRK